MSTPTTTTVHRAARTPQQQETLARVLVALRGPGKAEGMALGVLAALLGVGDAGAAGIAEEVAHTGLAVVRNGRLYATNAPLSGTATATFASDSAGLTAARRKALLEASPLGRQVLADEAATGKATPPTAAMDAARRKALLESTPLGRATLERERRERGR